MPIQQHPLPQDISSYKFRLIGDMTIRQFLYIGGFVILTILLHNSPIPFFFRYPLEILTLGLGIGLAFVPVQGRPLDQWII
ncbi:PrgI family protein, partial [Patescibacteria group bacterium]|nr:PrgI family protein [Patescibacteria group bacterium]